MLVLRYNITQQTLH